MPKKLLITAFLLMLSFDAHAQTVPMTEPLVTDRPDFTESTNTVAASHTQFEGGYTLTRSGSLKNHSFGEGLVRHGLSDRAELRLGLNSYEIERDTGERTKGRDDSDIGIKYVLSDGTEQFQLSRPAVALIVATEIPTGSRSQRVGGLQPFTKLCLAWPLNDNLGLAANLNVARVKDGGDHLTQLGASVSLGASLSPRVGAFAELFALEREERDGNGSQYFDTGLTYLINNDFQLDARVGLGFNPSVSGRDYFAGVGLARRF